VQTVLANRKAFSNYRYGFRQKLRYPRN